MNNIQIFKNNEFGEIRTIKENGKVLFCGSDVAKALGYQNTSKALSDHCKGVTKRYTPTQSGEQEMNFIPESDVYRLVFSSKLPNAERFTDWVTEEVLPAIRKTGKYESPAIRRHSMGEVNAAARIITQTLKEAGMAPQFRAVALKSLYTPIGVEIPLTGITTDRRTYDATTIAKDLGIYSKSGHPHGQAVSGIITQLDVSESEKELVPYQNAASGHSGANVQYTESVIKKVQLWLERFNYPSDIICGSKKYRVTYSAV